MRLFVLLALVGCCVADYLMQVNLVPKLLDEQLAYSIEAICAKNKMVVRAYSNNSQLTYDSAQLNLSNTMCPDGYQITVALRHKNNDKNSQLIYVWPTSYNLKRMLTQNDVDDHLLTPSKLQKLENELAAITQQDEEDIQRIFDDIEKVKIQVNSLVNDVEGLKKFVSNSATEINKYMEQKFN
uniref:GOLD domain-containing protein n=1 Tax=Globodera pallida TaxID=36090 RepID=A0A183BZF5_GLOPA